MTDNHSPTDPDSLFGLSHSLKEPYRQPPPQPPRPGKQPDFSALSFLLLAAVAVTLRSFRDSGLHRRLDKDTAVLASVWLYQSCYLDNHRNGKPLAHIKERLDWACWRIRS